MSDYKLQIEVLRDEANTIKADTNYFELNSKAKKMVDDLVELFEENMNIMQSLVSDVMNVNPDGTYYTKEDIDERINDLNEAKSHIQLVLLEQSKKNTQYDSFIESIIQKIDSQILKFNQFEKIVERVDTLEEMDKDNKILSWQSIEYTSEYIRQNHNTGVMSVNSGGTSMPKEAYEQPLATRYSPLNIHNHPNYSRMPGMGWFIYQANGFMGQTRHNDYRLNMQSASFMETVPNIAPSVPNYHFTVENMQNLFSRYLSKELEESEKELFRWDLSYLECWWQEVDSLDGVVSDTFDSFRHTFGNTKPTYLANRFATSRATGKKARFENIPFFPIASKSTDDNGNTKYSVFMYRIVTYPLTQFNGKRWDEVLDLKGDLIARANWGDANYDSYKARFKFKENDNSLWELIPGLGGTSEEIVDYKTIDGWDVVNPENKARYHRVYSVARDAVGRGSYANGWNDPTLITAFTKDKQVVHGTSYLIPLELILRTPLETWNPNDLEIKNRSKITGSGTTANPLNGFAENYYNYHTPSEFYNGFDGVDPADTGSTIKAIRNTHGDVGNYMASGIWINLPKIKNIEERVRIRYPLFWQSDEFSPHQKFLSAYIKENGEMMDFIKLNLLEKG
jgi:hypothetical protein